MSNLSPVIKSIQDVMRQDSGVDGDAQRISQLTWLLFLKVFDAQEVELEITRDRYQSPIPEPLRWRNWAADAEGMTGEGLLEFVNGRLFPQLKTLPGDARRNPRGFVVRSVFEDAFNYMKSGQLLRQVINKLNAIDFNRQAERHQFNDLYEKILKDLQSAGNAGEFYTPRAVTQFMVDMVDPRLGEVLLDPACGTGGFLVCALEHLRKQVNNEHDQATLQRSVRGVEKKQLPHMLCTTNMMLHGVEVPSLVLHDNTLTRPLRDYGAADRVEVIITNPPFGGVEEPGTENNFPADVRTKETADLFLVLIKHLLKQHGRGALVLPDGTLFGEGVKTRIKEQLLQECNLHTIVRLPNGVFAPYTGIKTNLLFFTKGRPTQHVWYYEHPYPPGVKNYNKTKPIRIEEFDAEKAWWGSEQDGFAARVENERAWKVGIDALRAANYNLDQKNPYVGEQTSHDPEALLADYARLHPPARRAAHRQQPGDPLRLRLHRHPRRGRRRSARPGLAHLHQQARPPPDHLAVPGAHPGRQPRHRARAGRPAQAAQPGRLRRRTGHRTSPAGMPATSPGPVPVGGAEAGNIDEQKRSWRLKDKRMLLSNFDLLATAPGGVAKLRELILTLAVQGKLVPQDPADEPASVLLQKIRAEKDRLITEGKIKRDKPLAAIADEEKPFELPVGWEWATLEKVGVINPRNNASDDVIASFVQMSSIPAAFSEVHVTESRLWRDIKSGFTQFAEGDIGVAKITPCFENGKSTVFQNLSNGIGSGTTELHIVRPLGGIAPRYVLLFLKTPRFLAEGEDLMTGSAGQKRVPRSYFESTPFPLPPVAEQSRIVTRVEELMHLCDALEAKGRLEATQHAQLVGTLLGTLTASATPEKLAAHWQRVAQHFDLLLDRPEAIDALEQTLLQLAVRGLLVLQDPADEPASELLKHIRAEKDRLIAAGQIKRDKPLLPISDEEKPFELPVGWAWVRLGVIADNRLGKMLDKVKNTGQRYPYLRNTNVQWGHIDLDDIKMISLEASELEEFRLIPGDLLICEGGYPGRCAIWCGSGREMYFQKALHRVRPRCGISAELIAISLESDSKSGNLDKHFTGATIKHFVGQALDRYVLPLPPLAEQSRIVARVTVLRRLCADLRQRLMTAQVTQSHLAQALVESCNAM